MSIFRVENQENERSSDKKNQKIGEKWPGNQKNFLEFQYKPVQTLQKIQLWNLKKEY